MLSSSGSVFYSRPGMLDVLCKFSGLAAFPYDTLKCAVEFGGWSMSAYHQGLRLSGKGYEFSSQETTAGASYQEFTIQKVEADVHNNFYACCADEQWPVATYRIFLKRASYYYTMLIVVPSLLITLLSFAVFFTQPEACDALAYGITVVLASELMKIVLVGVLPICGETVWIELFSQVSTRSSASSRSYIYPLFTVVHPLLTLVHPLLFSQVNSFFCVLALFESVAQTVVEYTHEASFFPEWVTEPVTRLAAIVTATWRKTRGGELAVPADESIRAQFANQSSVAGVVCRRLSGGRSESLSSRLEQLGEMADKLRQGTYAGDTGRSPPPIAGGLRRGRGVASPRTCLPLAPAAARWSWAAPRPRLTRSLRWLPIPTPAPDMP